MKPRAINRIENGFRFCRDGRDGAISERRQIGRYGSDIIGVFQRRFDERQPQRIESVFADIVAANGSDDLHAVQFANETGDKTRRIKKKRVQHFILITLLKIFERMKNLAIVARQNLRLGRVVPPCGIPVRVINFDAMHPHFAFLPAHKAFIKRHRHAMLLQGDDVYLQAVHREQIGDAIRRMSNAANLRRILVGDNAGF
jgi:hypothetical protein